MKNGLQKRPFTKTLLGERIQLVAASAFFADSLWESILRDREARLGASWVWLQSVDELREYLSKCSFENPSGEIVYLFKKNDVIFGSFHIHTMCYADYKTEIGYAIEKAYEGQGYVQEAIKLVEEELKRLEFNKLIINCDIENTRSVKVAERAGYTREGTLKDDCIENGVFRTSALFGKIL